MIKINLLGVKKEVKKSAMAGPSVSLEGTKLIVFGLLFTAAGLGYCYYRYITLDSQEKKIAADQKFEEKRKTELTAVKTQVEQLERVKGQLQHQIDVIQGLERGRTGPVVMLNTLANTVVGTKTMWLLTFDNTGNKISISGMATSMNTVADFLRNLQNSGQFANVEMKETAQDETRTDLKVYKFDITADVVSNAPAPDAPKGR
jgi:Tfp pilus assembly protein PilN